MLVCEGTGEARSFCQRGGPTPLPSLGHCGPRELGVDGLFPALQWGACNSSCSSQWQKPPNPLPPRSVTRSQLKRDRKADCFVSVVPALSHSREGGLTNKDVEGLARNWGCCLPSQHLCRCWHLTFLRQASGKPPPFHSLSFAVPHSASLQWSSQSPLAPGSVAGEERGSRWRSPWLLSGPWFLGSARAPDWQRGRGGGV